MGFFDFLKPKPQRCTRCQADTLMASELYSGLSGGEVTAVLCPKCLLKELGKACQGKNILFVEPLVMDYYLFTPGDSPDINTLVQQRLQAALERLGRSCAECAQPAEHLWMPQSDLDRKAMGQLPEDGYTSIASLPQDWKASRSYCLGHVLEKLEKHMEQEKSGFLTFRLPNEAAMGYYE